ncbi:MAG: hypothetical protein FGM39_01150 [Phycisphaerales bacterium]|nr:hypothetical protein [Phycisphaerales bacterium]
MTPKRKKPLAATTAAAAAAFAIQAAAHAAVTVANYAPCKSTEGFGDFLATVTYTYTGGTSASLSVQLDNTTLPALGGYITAFALNPGTGVTAMAFVSSTSANFSGLSGPVSTPPFGSFMTGASTGSGWLGGGSPNGGIGIGMSATFVFSMTGSAAALGALDAETVLAAGCDAMAVRFRGGAVTGWSDKVLGQALPTPGTLAVAGLAALGRRRRRR